ncbi:hypothetical protein E2C01_082511 [Portunus trituberculatus]|uniref:Uncharacterized protein n=1 Tax=Portunus trituberculatus TaxID=210409 RepID=A0A5B7ISJ5_PORTR|nr:hypothetical protein [Portunus trituberculatus]
MDVRRKARLSPRSVGSVSVRGASRHDPAGFGRNGRNACELKGETRGRPTGSGGRPRPARWRPRWGGRMEGRTLSREV